MIPQTEKISVSLLRPQELAADQKSSISMYAGAIHPNGYRLILDFLLHYSFLSCF